MSVVVKTVVSDEGALRMSYATGTTVTVVHLRK